MTTADKVRKLWAWSENVKIEECKMCNDCETCENYSKSIMYGSICRAVHKDGTYEFTSKYERCPVPSQRVEKKKEVLLIVYEAGKIKEAIDRILNLSKYDVAKIKREAINIGFYAQRIREIEAEYE